MKYKLYAFNKRFKTGIRDSTKSAWGWNALVRPAGGVAGAGERKITTKLSSTETEKRSKETTSKSSVLVSVLYEISSVDTQGLILERDSSRMKETNPLDPASTGSSTENETPVPRMGASLVGSGGRLRVTDFYQGILVFEQHKRNISFNIHNREYKHSVTNNDSVFLNSVA